MPVIVPPSGRRDDEDAYRRQFSPLPALSGCDDSPAYGAAKSMARLRVAESFRREGRLADARRSYSELAADKSAALHHRARAMLALGDLDRDQGKYTAARAAYEKTRDFFVAKHEAFRVEAIQRLREVDTHGANWQVWNAGLLHLMATAPAKPAAPKASAADRSTELLVCPRKDH